MGYVPMRRSLVDDFSSRESALVYVVGGCSSVRTTTIIESPRTRHPAGSPAERPPPPPSPLLCQPAGVSEEEYHRT